MKFTETKLKGAYIIDLEKLEDTRGFFARFFCIDEFEKSALNTEWVQGNMSLSRKRGTLRGLHYQSPPYQEVKLVRCTRGEVFDVILDLRPDSNTFGDWFGINLSDRNYRTVYVPQGFAHGFVTLKDNSEVNYLVSQFYNPEAERGIRHNDPLFNIEWPIEVAVISEKDASWPDYSRRK